MMKKIENSLKLLLIVIMCSAFLVKPIEASAAAETLGDLRKDYEDLLKEKRAKDNESDKTKNEIKQKEAAIAQARDDLTEAEAQEEEVQLKITESNQAIEENKKESEKVLVYMQQVQNKNAYVEYVTGSSSMTELVTRIEAVKQVSDYIQVTLDNLEAEIDKNEKLKKELEDKQRELSAKIVNFQSAVSKLNKDVSELDEMANDLETQVKLAKEAYDKNASACQKKVGSTADSVRLTSCYDLPYNGQWLLPLKSGVVTSRQGYRLDPITHVPYSFHSGIDIGVPDGTPVYASAAGKVSGIVDHYSCGGNKVYIDVTVNGKKYTTFYLHLLKYNVKIGDIVTQNTIIGYSGGGSTAFINGGYDKCTTGAHLHYGVQTGWYDTKRGIINSNVIEPPGLKNAIGWRFNSRTALYFK